MPADGYLNFNTKIDTNGFKKGMDSVEATAKSYGGTLDKLSGKIKMAFSVAAVAAFGKAAIESAADFKAAGSQFSQTFDDMADDAKTAITRVAGPADILETRLQESAASIYAFAKTAKMDASTAMMFMEDALQAAADSAAYYDRSLEDTTATLRSFLKGNYENDAALGLSATETTRNAKAMEMYGKKFVDLTEAQKQLALLEMVKDANRLSGAMGQAAREADGWENVTGNLSEAWDKLLAAVGQPMLKLAVPVVKQMTGALVQMTTWANNAYSALAQVFGWQEAQTDEVSASVDAQDDLTKAVNETTAAQKKALAGFDEIEVLASSAAESMGTDSASGIAGAGGIASDVAEVSDNTALTGTYEKLALISGKLDEIKEIFLTGFWEGFEGADFSDIETSISRIATYAKQLLSDEAIGESAKKILERAVHTRGQIIGIFSNIWATIATIASMAGADFIGLLTTPIDENSEEIEAALDETAVHFDLFLDRVGGLTNEVSDDVISLYEEDISPFFDTLTDTASAWMGEFVEEYREKIGPVLEEASSEVDDLIDNHLKPMFDKLFDYIGSSADLANTTWASLKNFGGWLAGTFVNLMSNSFKNAKNAVMNALYLTTGYINSLLTVLIGINEFISGVFSGDWEKAWGGIKNIFVGILNVMIITLESFINSAINGLNSVIGGIDTVVGAIGSAVGKDWNIPFIPKVTLPRLASGAVIPPNREFLAVLGDQKHGTNIEAPLDTILEAFRTALAESRGDGMTEVVLEIDGREFGRAVVEQGERENRRVGTRLVVT